MADIFLSYTRGDAAKVRELAAELEQRGFSVFWDTAVLPGQQWRDVIHNELVEAACVIVVWSQGSTRSRWVVEEASEALEEGKLLPVLLDDSLPPFGFRGVEAANLSGWTPGTSNLEFDNLVDAVRRIAAVDAPEGDVGDEEPAHALNDLEEESETPSIAGDTTTIPKSTSPHGGTVMTPPTGESLTPPTEDTVTASPTEETVTPETEPSGPPAPPQRDEPALVPQRDEPERGTPADPVTVPSDPRPPVVETPMPTHRDPAPSGLEAIIARLGTGGLVGVGAAIVLVIAVWILVADGGGDDPPPTTLAGGGVTTTTDEVTTTVDVTDVVERDTVTAFRAATAPVIDGNLGEWDGVPEAYRLRTEVFRAGAVDNRLGADSPAVVLAQYDDSALYLAVVSDDDIYSQLNTGNQIWRGDALDINLTTASPGSISERPDGDDFQLTMTPRNADGAPSIVWFTGNGSGFADNTTQLPVTLAGVINDGGPWQLEASIPWTVFGLQGPPDGDLAALVAVFDNDGEVVDGQPQQTVILGHTSAEFQRPLTWGTLELDG